MMATMIIKKLSMYCAPLVLTVLTAFGNTEKLIDPTVFKGEKAFADLQELPLDEVYAGRKTSTSIGNAVLVSQTPLVDRVIIEARASSIDVLAGSPDQLSQIHKLLGETEAGMNELVEYAGGARLYSEVTNPFYLPEWRYFFPRFFAYLNNTPRVLDSGMALSAAWRGIVILNALALSGVFSEFLASRFVGGNFSLEMALKSGPGSILMSHSVYRSVDDKILLSPQAYARFNALSLLDKIDLFAAIYYEREAGFTLKQSNRTVKSKVLAALPVGIYTAWTDYVQITALSNSVASLNDMWKKIGVVHVSLCKVARIISAAFELAGRLELCNETYLSQKIYDALEHLESESPRLYEILSTETFACESDVYSRGRVLVAHRLLLKEWESFKKLCTVLGELDAIVAWSTVVAEEPGAWSTPVIDDQLVLQKLRHPLLPLEPDSGQDIAGAPLIIITGPNGSGKTTALESVALAAVIHQTWGIVPARHARMPIYRTIATSLRALGSVMSGKSRFIAQLEQLDKLFDAIKTVQGLALVLVDEPLNGTVQESAGKHIVEWCKKCISYGTATIMLATHCAEPTKIDGAVLLQPEVREIAPGKFVRTFKLIPGQASWWFSDIARRDRFIIWLAHLEGRI